MDAVDILTRAIKLEEKGRKAYLQAAERCQDPETKQVFLTLAEDELHHHAYLERQTNEFQAGRSWVAVPELGTVSAIDAESPIFPTGKQAIDQLPADASEEDALLFGMGVEMKSYTLYHQSAKEVTNPEANKMFNGLASAERHHFDLLMMRYESQFGYPR